MCGDFRARNGYGARVVLLTRSGKVLDSDFGEKAEKPDPKMVAKVTEILTNRFKIEIKQGTASGPEGEQASLSPGTLKLESGESLSLMSTSPASPRARTPATSSLPTRTSWEPEAGKLGQQQLEPSLKLAPRDRKNERTKYMKTSQQNGPTNKVKKQVCMA